jgi:putative phosphoesterase
MPRDFQIIQSKITKEESLIGVLSDTHIPTMRKEVPAQVSVVFKDVDLVIHAGDLVSLEVVRELEKIAPVIAVSGNMDTLEVRQKLPPAVCLRIYNWKVGVIHDSVFPLVGSRMKGIARKNGLDILIFGHTHRPLLKRNDILIMNPGSPTSPLWSKPSVGLLKINKHSYEGKIVHLTKEQV